MSVPIQRARSRAAGGGILPRFRAFLRHARARASARRIDPYTARREPDNAALARASIGESRQVTGILAELLVPTSLVTRISAGTTLRMRLQRMYNVIYERAAVRVGPEDGTRESEEARHLVRSCCWA
jgi:hypothetical protein